MTKMWYRMLSKNVTKRLTHEVKAALAKCDRRGQSKHAAKQAARAEAQRTQSHYTQITGLYATSSYATYVKQALTALRWIADRYGCKRLNECRPYLPAYYSEMRRGDFPHGRYARGSMRCARSMMPIMRHCSPLSICPPVTVPTSSAGGKSARRTPGITHPSKKLCARLPAPAGHVVAGFWD